MKTVYKPRAASKIKPVRKGSKKALIPKGPVKGLTVDDIVKLTGWKRTAAASCLRTDIAAAGYGLTLNDHVYKLVLPRGMARLLIGNP